MFILSSLGIFQIPLHSWINGSLVFQTPLHSTCMPMYGFSWFFQISQKKTCGTISSKIFQDPIGSPWEHDTRTPRVISPTSSSWSRAPTIEESILGGCSLMLGLKHTCREGSKSYVCVYVFLHVCTYVFMYACMHLYVLWMYMYVYVHVCICVLMYVNVCLYVCICMYWYVCMYVYV